MTLTAMIGALVALVPPALFQKPKQPQEGLERAYEQLARSRARLIDHIEALERELLIERHISFHWKEEAQRLAKQSREERERQIAQRQTAELQALSQAQQGWAALGGIGQMTEREALQWCNCVPSRAQAWSAERKPVA